jgi:hypothetical protein
MDAIKYTINLMQAYTEKYALANDATAELARYREIERAAREVIENRRGTGALHEMVVARKHLDALAEALELPEQKGKP